MKLLWTQQRLSSQSDWWEHVPPLVTLPDGLTVTEGSGDWDLTTTKLIEMSSDKCLKVMKLKCQLQYFNRFLQCTWTLIVIIMTHKKQILYHLLKAWIRQQWCYGNLKIPSKFVQSWRLKKTLSLLILTAAKATTSKRIGSVFMFRSVSVNEKRAPVRR